jgi:putative FmdB family regulatory protein
MPIFDFVCRKCEHSFETLIQNGEDAECPKCHATQLERLLSVPARPIVPASAGACSADPSLPPCGPMCRRSAAG